MDDVCEGRKALNGSGPPDNQQEVTMRLITRFDAASRSTAELHALLREAFNALIPPKMLFHLETKHLHPEIAG